METIPIMRKPAAYLTAILVGAIVWFFFQNFHIEGTDALRVIPKADLQIADATEPANALATPPEKSPGTFSLPNILKRATNSAANPTAAPSTAAQLQTQKVSTNTPPPPALTLPNQGADTIRIGSFHLHFFGASAENPQLTMNAVARIVRLVDILALQGVSPGGEAAIADLATKAGPQYGYVLGEPADIAHQDEVYAYIYNTTTIVADRGEGLYTLGDPDNLLRRDPLIGWFRAKKPKEENAFTFTLVNVNTERRHALQELNVLDNVMHEVRNDWRGEDDVIMLGCFQRPETQLEQLGRIRGIVPAIRGISTHLNGRNQTENILFQRTATDEFTGRSGVFQFLRAYNLSMNQAMQVSEYLPVWAEFSIYEKGVPGKTAN